MTTTADAQARAGVTTKRPSGALSLPSSSEQEIDVAAAMARLRRAVMRRLKKGKTDD